MQVDSDEETDTSHWEIRGLLETSTETILSVHDKRSRYGTTSEMMIPGAEDKHSFLRMSPQDHTHLHPYHLSPRGGTGLGKKHHYGDGRGRKTLMKQNGTVGLPPPPPPPRREKEGENEGQIYTRVVSIEIGRGNSVRFSQSAPSIAPAIPSPRQGGRAVSPLAKKEEKEEEEEEREEEEEEEEGYIPSGKRERGRRRWKTASRKREGSSSSRSQEEGKPVSPTHRAKPKRRDNMSRRKESSSGSERGVPSKGGSSDFAVRLGGRETTHEAELERGSPPLEHVIMIQRESSPAKLREASPEVSSRTESHRGSGGSGSAGDPLEVLPCEQVLFHDPDLGGDGGREGGGRGLSKREEGEEGRKEEREKH